MAGKKLTQEEKEKIFQRIVETEKDPYWKRRYIKQWHEGTLKIYKKRGRICWESPAEVAILPDGNTGFDVVVNDESLRVLTKEERETLSRKEDVGEKAGVILKIR